MHWSARLFGVGATAIVWGACGSGCGSDDTPATPSLEPDGGPAVDASPSDAASDASEDAGFDASFAQRARVLVVTHVGPTGFRHGSIPVAEQTFDELSRASGGILTVSFARNADDVTASLTPAALANVDAVFFANTAGNLGLPDLAGFLDWIAAGHAFLGAHAASDTYHDEPSYLAMLGGEFAQHGAECEVEPTVEAATHPAVAHLAPSFRVLDEIYEFKASPRPNVSVLFATKTHPPDGHPEAGTPGDFPLAWTRPHGTGRVFYTALGHRDDVWKSAWFRQHLRGAIAWATAPR